MTAVSGDLLAASSLLATLVGILYSTWYPGIKDAAERVVAPHTRGTAPARARATLWLRAAPLFVLTVLLAGALAQPAWAALRATWQGLFGSQPGHHYDPVQACFVLVFAAVVGLVLATWMAFRDAWHAVGNLKSNR